MWHSHYRQHRNVSCSSPNILHVSEAVSLIKTISHSFLVLGKQTLTSRTSLEGFLGAAWTKGGSSLLSRIFLTTILIILASPRAQSESLNLCPIKHIIKSSERHIHYQIGLFHTLCSLRNLSKLMNEPQPGHSSGALGLCLQQSVYKSGTESKFQLSSYGLTENQGSQDWFSELIAFLTALEISLNSSQVRSASWVVDEKIKTDTK